jgi:pseudouridine kinase
MKFDAIYCIGGAAIDYKIKPLTTLQAATSNPARTNIHYGGVARNVAENLIYLTDNIHLCTMIGDDTEGKALLNHAQQLGIDIHHSCIMAHQRTARYYAILDNHGELHQSFADMEIYDGLNFKLTIPPLEKNSIVFLDTNFPENFLAAIIKVALEQKVRLIIDPVSVMKSHKLPTNLQGVFLIKPNQEEAQALSHLRIQSINDAITAGKKILDRGVTHVVISLGKAGYVLVNQEEIRHEKVDIIHELTDANGAGDAFCAGILYALQQQKSIGEACQFGAQTAALTVRSSLSVSTDIKSLSSTKRKKDVIIF